MSRLHWIFYSAVAYTVLGLLGGLYYRELTKTHDFTGETQLSVVHTHLLALGLLFFLIVMALERTLALSTSQWFVPFFISYQAGLLVTVTVMIVHGTLTVLGGTVGPAVSGIAGVGHIGLTIGLVTFFLALKERVDAVAAAPSAAQAPAQAPAPTPAPTTGE